MSLHDFLRFEGGVAATLPQRERLGRFEGKPLMDDGAMLAGWEGEWPPPERVMVVVGKQTGIVMILDPDFSEVPRDEMESACDLTIYRRESASQLPDDLDHSHVARGALYKPEP